MGLQMGPGKTRPVGSGWVSGSEKTLENVTFERFRASGRMEVSGSFSNKFGRSNLRSIFELFGLALGALLAFFRAPLGLSWGPLGALWIGQGRAKTAFLAPLRSFGEAREGGNGKETTTPRGAKTGLQIGPGKTTPGGSGWGSGGEKTLENG